jgi:ADP-ribosylglycohydrolase
VEAFAEGFTGENGTFLGELGGPGGATKVSFVIYYMKLNTVTTSLVTEVSKPTHNGSIAGPGASTADYAVGNPWDASKDDADNTADWNVSTDLLIRFRVTGFFLNANPSGRARDDTNPLNVLPADRWVMPTDWALLAGGPADPADGTDALGTA